MSMDLQALLPQLLPRAIAWAEAVAGDVATNGEALNDARSSIASRVGVQHPHNVRVLLVDQLPLPADPELQAAATQTGLLGKYTVGLTLGYSVLIRRGHMTQRLLSHELRHVHQFEKAGGIADFLPLYLGSIIQFGYQNSPYEQDARDHELTDT